MNTRDHLYFKGHCVTSALYASDIIDSFWLLQCSAMITACVYTTTGSITVVISMQQAAHHAAVHAGLDHLYVSYGKEHNKQHRD
jgi:hypothetical protein